MDHHAIEYFQPYSEESPHSHFHAVISLHENLDLSWAEVSSLSPELCRGWYELAHLSTEDRINFIKEFWLAKMPYHPDLNDFLNRFFGSIDDIGIFLTQQKYDDPFEAHCVYSLINDSGFFHGRGPASESEIIDLQKHFSSYILPRDYLAFLQIHNGFAKLTDTGIMRIEEMKENDLSFHEKIEMEDPLVAPDGRLIDPKSLIPFYKSFGMPFFQCFWGEWYPNNEMGNVYYSDLTKSISDCTKTDFRVETMAFETFTDWLIFYLETIE